jgi:hypothetical protein
METLAVAKKLIRYCREQRHKTALRELYAENCVSREMPGTPEELVTGKPAILQKNKKWFESVKEFHECDVSDAIIAGNFFVCRMTIDVTFYGQPRMQLEEICVYEVANGQIVSEQYFY